MDLITAHCGCPIAAQALLDEALERGVDLPPPDRYDCGCMRFKPQDATQSQAIVGFFYGRGIMTSHWPPLEFGRQSH